MNRRSLFAKLCGLIAAPAAALIAAPATAKEVTAVDWQGDLYCVNVLHLPDGSTQQDKWRWDLESKKWIFEGRCSTGPVIMITPSWEEASEISRQRIIPSSLTPGL